MSLEKLKGTCRVALILGLLAVVPGSLPANTYSNWGFPLPTVDPNLSLGAVGATNDQFHFTINGVPNTPYVVELSSNLVDWVAVLTNSDSTATRYVTVASSSARFVRTWRAAVPMISGAITTRGNISLNGIGITTDSFNSEDPTLSTDGQYDPTKARANGNITSLNGAVNFGNHEIDGQLFLGPGAFLASGTNNIVGGVSYNGDIQIPDATLPATVYLDAPISGTGTNQIHDFAASGNYELNDSWPIQVEAGVRVILDVTNSLFILGHVTILGGLSNPGNLVIYQETGSAIIRTQTPGPGNRPADFWFFGLPGVTNISLQTYTNVVGVIYAPEAAVSADGGGLSYDFAGSIVAGSLLMNGRVGFHFDESLRSSGPIH